MSLDSLHQVSQKARVKSKNSIKFLFLSWWAFMIARETEGLSAEVPSAVYTPRRQGPTAEFCISLTPCYFEPNRAV